MRFGINVLIIRLVVIGLLAGSLAAQQPELVVGSIDFPERAWGNQELPFEVTNNTDWLKFLVIEAHVGFEGSYVNPHRVTRTNVVLEPGKLAVEVDLVVPSNYGLMTLWLRIYDVVDTLDDLTLGTKIFEQPFKIKFLTPEAVLPYFEERLTLPPLAGNSGMLDNEFARLMLVLTGEGKSLEEIAEICQADTVYVNRTAYSMVRARYLSRDSGGYAPAVPVISNAYAADGRRLADQTADRLAAVITANLTHRRRFIDSLMQAGVYTGDSANFFEGGTLLYQPYPLVAGLYLWQVLGQKFITGQEGLRIFENTNPCEPRLGQFTYLVQGGDYYNGQHYFNAQRNQGEFAAHFGDTIPVVECRPGFERKQMLRENVDWSYAAEYRPEIFLYDTVLIGPMIRILDLNTEDILRDAIGGLRELNRKHGVAALPVGVRYWFWNLTATRAVANLVASGTLTRLGNGQFRLMEKGE